MENNNLGGAHLGHSINFLFGAYSLKNVRHAPAMGILARLRQRLYQTHSSYVAMSPFPPAIYICTKLERHIVCNVYYRKHYLLFFIRILSVVTTVFFALLL